MCFLGSFASIAAGNRRSSSAGSAACGGGSWGLGPDLGSAAGHVDEVRESLEQVERVVRARCGLGVVLNGERLELGNGEAFARLVVEVHVRGLRAPLERSEIDGEAVVLRGDLDLAGGLVEHRLVDAAMAELELVRGGAEGEAEKLVPEADAEEGSASEEALDGVDGVRDRGRITGSIGKEH